MNDVQTAWCCQIPGKFRGSYRKAVQGKYPMAAIRAKCLDCMAYQGSEVSTCTVVHCPLWPYRSGHRKGSRPNLNAHHARFQSRTAAKGPVGLFGPDETLKRQ